MLAPGAQYRQYTIFVLTWSLVCPEYARSLAAPGARYTIFDVIPDGSSSADTGLYKAKKVMYFCIKSYLLILILWAVKLKLSKSR